MLAPALLPDELLDAVLIAAMRDNTHGLICIPLIGKSFNAAWKERHAMEWALLSGHYRTYKYVGSRLHGRAADRCRSDMCAISQCPFQMPGYACTSINLISVKHTRQMAIAVVQRNVDDLRKLAAIGTRDYSACELSLLYTAYACTMEDIEDAGMLRCINEIVCAAATQ